MFFISSSDEISRRKVMLLLALSVVMPRIYIKIKKLFKYFIKKLTLVVIPKLSRLLRKNSLRFLPEWEPSSLIKSNNMLFNSHSSFIQWAVTPKKEMKFEDVHASSVNDILPFTS